MVLGKIPFPLPREMAIPSRLLAPGPASLQVPLAFPWLCSELQGEDLPGLIPGLSEELAPVWAQPVGDSDGRLKDGKRRNQAVSYPAYLFKMATLAAN